MTRHNICTVWHSKNRMRPIAMIVLVAMLCTLLPVAALAGDTENDAQTGKTINLLESGVAVTTPSGIFSELTLSVKDSVVNSEGELKLNFAFALDDTTRQVIYEEATSGSSIQYRHDFNSDTEYDAYLNGCTDDALPPIEFSFNMDSSAGIKLSETMNTQVMWGEAPVGEFTVAQNEDGTLQFTCKLNKALYNPTYDNISGGGNFTVQFKRGDMENQKPVLEWTENAGTVTIKFPDLPEVDTSGTKFAVEKETIGAIRDNKDKDGDKNTTENIQTSPYLDYQITLTSTALEKSNVEQVYLNNLLFADKLPKGLQVTSVQVVYTFDNSTETDTEPQKVTYAISNDNILTAWLPEQPENIVKAVYTVHTQLNEEEYKNYLNKNDYNKEFTNTAQLILPADDNKVLGADSVTDTIYHQWLVKDGKQVGLDSRKFAWIINASAYFGGIDTVYLIDQIENPTQHTYDKVFGLYLEMDNKKERLTVKDVTGDDELNYETITAEALEKKLNLNDGEAVYYTVKGSDENIRQQLLIMKLPAELRNGEFQLHYQTNWNDNAGDEYGADLKNSVRLVWMADGFGEPPTWRVDKDVYAHYPIVNKKGAGYDANTQTVTWQFDVNQYGTTLSAVTIKDTIDTSKYELVQPASDAAIEVTRFDRATGAPIKSEGSFNVSLADSMDNNVLNYYTISQNSQNDKLTTLTFHFENVPEDEVWRFYVKTKVVNADDLLYDKNVEYNDSTLKQKGITYKNVANKIEVTAIIANETITQEITAAQPVWKTWISKDCTDTKDGYGYNPLTHEILWKVIANHNYLPVENMVITDTIPLHMTYAGVKTATCKSGPNDTAEHGILDQDGNAIYFTQHGIKLVIKKSGQVAIDNSTENQEEVKFAVKDLDGNSTTTTCQFTLDVRTAYPPEYYNNHFFNKTVQEDGTEPVTPIRQTAVNKAALSGTLYSKSFNVDASAKCEFMPSLLKKEGTYHAYKENSEVEPYIDWTVTVNEAKINLGLTDDTGTYHAAFIKDDIAQGMELDIDSLKITANGKAIDKANFDLTGVTKQGLVISVPKEYDDKTLTLTFHTTLVDDMKAADMHNDIVVKCPKLGDVESGADAKDRQDFSLSAYATLTKKPVLMVEKISSHTANGENVLLNGAEFTLTKGAKDESGNWTFDTESAVSGITRSGRTSFMKLRTDSVYKLEETKAPEGYLKTDDSAQYVVFADKENFTDSVINNKNVTVYNVSTGYFQTVTVTNTPTRGCIVGHKQDIVGAGGLAGATIGLFNDETKEPALQTAESGEFGQFNFNNLTPGTYYIKELQAPKGYYLNETPVTVTLTDANCAPDSVPVTVDAAGNPIVIEDEAIPVRGCIIGKKTDTAGKPLAGAVITLTSDARRNDGNETVNKTCTTNDNGLFSFSDLKPGTYTLQETTAPKGYQLSDKVFTVTLQKADCESGYAVRIDTEDKPLTIVNTKIPSSGGGETPITPPEKPIEPTEPTKPTEPEKPTEPIKPTELAVPEQPVQPTEPTTPQHPEWGDLPTELPYPVTADSPDEITILEDGVPTTYVKMWDPETEEFIYIPEDEVPLTSAEPEEPIGDAPATGDNAPVTAMLLLLAASAAGLRVVTRKEEK